MANTNREEAMRLAAERMRLKKEKEEREEKEFYERVTSGTPWMIFKVVMIFGTLLSLVTTIDHFVDGPSRKISEEEWKINRDWEWMWHKIVDVENSMFAPESRNWGNRVENSTVLVYSPILHAPKKLKFKVKINEAAVFKHEEIRWRSIFEWFPAFQVVLLIPLFTFIFKRQKPWFNFARIASFVLVLPGALVVLYFTLF